MFDYIVVVVGDDTDVRYLEHYRWRADVALGSVIIPVAESGWHGSAGNGLGTLFAIKNASEAAGIELISEVKRGKSVLIVHTAGEGTRNILTRTCKNKAFIDVPGCSVLEGVIKQFQRFSIPGRIVVTWCDQFIFIDDAPARIADSAARTHVMLLGLKTELTEEIAARYGVQIVRCGPDGCVLLDFDDTRNYEAVRAKIARHSGADVLLNLGVFTLSGRMAEHMLEVFADELETRTGRFNSDELWQLWVSPDPVSSDEWLRARAERLKTDAEELIRSFAISESSIWLDFGTNSGYYENMMRLLDRDEEYLRKFLNVELITTKVNGCEILDSIYSDSDIENGTIRRSVVSNTVAKSAMLDHTCVFNSRLNTIRCRDCVVYNVVEHTTVELDGIMLVDVFHPVRGRIRLRFPTGMEYSPREEWWYKPLPGNTYSLNEVAAMMRGVALDDMEATKERHARLAEALMHAPEDVKRMVERPIRIKPVRIPRPWGYELWCASPRNCIDIYMDTDMQPGELTLCELVSFLPDDILGTDEAKVFPLMVKIIKADDNLSIQVHPDDDYAHEIGDVMGKEEAWYVLDAHEDARVYLGFRNRISTAEFSALVRSGELLEHMDAFDAHRGDIYHIPAGVIHALGAGTKVYEVSTVSERTFRIYDYGRGRALHLEDAANVLRFEPVGGLNCAGERMRGDHLALEHISVHGVFSLDTADMVVLTCVGGELTLNGVQKMVMPDTILIPAKSRSVELEGDGELICARFIP